MAKSDAKEWYHGLTAKQRRFCEAYASNGNALKSAEIAGYAKPSPQSAQVLESLSVQQALEKLRLTETKRYIATREERQEFWTRVMMGLEQDADGSPVKMRDRLKAAELLGRSGADFLERIQHSGDADNPLKIVMIPSKKAKGNG